ncbi:Basic helix-loop-helix transcription factor [Parasponia andersonii]|uniref:Basic helix-loop-helix transcription factor n=1 Tax=Parasponia andersonii TaxID=3476 RepID=A0A2P5CTQ7_PARAD|nr:Basic helix-loop-helix transcription factor [Parasponia andersonii]
MALEAVVFSQNPFCYSANKDLYNMLGGNWVSYNDDKFTTLEKENTDLHDQDQADVAPSSFDFLGNQTETTCPYGDWNPSPSSMVPHFNELHLSNNNPSDLDASGPISPSEFQPFDGLTTVPTTMTRSKRRRSRSRKNKEDIENQRMTHIAVERNRRKQMNEYLSMLRSLMPDSYVQRGDQASIIGGAINFVKELEQQVQFLGAQKEINKSVDHHQGDLMPFSEFFTFPQYSTSSTQYCDHDNSVAVAGDYPAASAGERRTGIADIEVTMVESHANLKIRSRKRSKQLVKLVSGLHALRLTVLHLNVTTQDQIVLYSISVKVEDDCKLSSVDEIATAVYEIIARIQEETLMAN